MIDIDRYAYSNRLLNVNPMEKFTFAVSMMILCLLSQSVIMLLVIVLLMGGLVVFVAKIPLKYYAKLMSLPVSFLLVGVVTIAFSVSTNAPDFIASAHVFGYDLGVRLEDLGRAVHLFSMSLGTVSCLYFLSLTTPMVEIFAVLRRLKVPGLLIEIMSLTYRFIFVLLDTTGTIRTSQSSRLGYTSAKNSFRSLSHLFSSLFVRALHRSQLLSTAMMSRGYTGELVVLEQEYPVCTRNYLIMAVVELALIFMNLYLGGTLA